MPSLVRFLVFVGVLSAIVYGSLYVLAEYFEPEPQEVVRTLPGVKIKK